MTGHDEVRVLDLFAGPGGWSEACATLLEPEVGIEWDLDAVQTARAAGHYRIHGDVRHVDPPPGAFDGLLASPPCQTFSRAGRGSGTLAVDDLLAALPLVADGVRPLDALTEVSGTRVDETPLGFTWDAPVVHDERSALVLEPLRVIRRLRPRWLALEQVPAVLPIWQAYATQLELLGYRTWTGILTAEAYGVPQTRRRAILLANANRSVYTPPPTHSRYYAGEPTRLDEGVLPWISMADALSWGMTSRPYVTVAAGTSAGGTDPQVLGGSAARAVVIGERDAGRWVPRFREATRTPYDPRWPEFRPSTTVQGRDTIAHPGPTWNRDNGSSKSRNDGVRVTVAEAGILQGFPADYPWSGGITSKYQQVGDAIPPPLAEAIIEAAR